jgi:uncharacterized protein
VSNLFAATPLQSSLGLTLVFLVFFVAGTVKGILGLGMPTVAMALLGFTMPPQRAAALLLLPSLITNVWQVFAGPPVGRTARRFWPLLVTIAAGTLVGVWVLGTRLGGGATLLLGFVLATYGVVGLAAVRLTVPAAHEFWLGPAVGVTTGLLNAATGVSVMPLAPYLQSLGLAKEDLVQALGLCFLVAILALGTGLTLTMKLQFTWQELTLPLIASLGGMATGQAVRRRLSAEIFRRYFFVGLVLVGSYLAVHAA